MIIPAHVRAIDRGLARVKRELDYLRYINPTNGLEEKKRFLNSLAVGKSYEPIFHYPRRPTLLLQRSRNELRAIAECVHRCDEPFRTLFTKEVEDQRLRIRLIGAIGTARSTSVGQKLFGSVDPTLLRKARKAVQRVGSFKLEGGKEVGPDELLRRATRALGNAGINGWTASIHHALGIPSRVDERRRRVLFQKQDRYSGALVADLIAHEIMGHARQDTHAAQQPLKLLNEGWGRYEPYHEGYAVWQERTVNPDLEPRLALYYLATAFAQDHSLSETHLYLTEWLDAGPAYDLAARVKRGLTNTARTGGWMKDVIYWEGYCAFKDLETRDRQLVARAKFDPRLLEALRAFIT